MESGSTSMGCGVKLMYYRKNIILIMLNSVLLIF